MFSFRADQFRQPAHRTEYAAHQRIEIRAGCSWRLAKHC
jgi:hypothetical protein